MSNEWDDLAKDWGTDPLVQQYAENAFQQLKNRMVLNGLSVFDFGCGAGNLTALLSPSVEQVIALDASAEMCKSLQNKNLNNVSVISELLTQELIDTHPKLSKKFDLIVASSVCSFLPDYESSLELLNSMLKQGGLFVQWDWLETGTTGMGLSESRVYKALEQNNFSNINISVPFVMQSSKGTMQVLMAVGKKS